MADTPKHSINLVLDNGAGMVNAMMRPHQVINADLGQELALNTWFFGAPERPLSTHPGNAFFFEMD